MNQPDHGSRNTYTNWKCRCEDCRAANTQYVRERREARRQLLAESSEVARAEALNAKAAELEARLCRECWEEVPEGATKCPDCESPYPGRKS